MNAVLLPEPTSPRSRFLTVCGWVCIVLGSASPLRVGLALGDVRSNLYVSNLPIYCAYDIFLSALTAVTGWGLLERRRWAPLLGSIAAGAVMALGAGSLLVLRLKYFMESAPAGRPHDRLQFCADHWAFILVNAGLVIAWGYALGRLIRCPVRSEFPPAAARPLGLLGAFFLSFVASFALTWWVWATFIVAAEYRW
jgi:hypothetical protein